MTNLNEKTIDSKVKYRGHIVNVRVDDVELSNKEQHIREVVEHPGGVVIIPVLSAKEVVLIKQWRYPIDNELLELPAGKLNLKEDPFLAAKRELQEETGYIANTWEYLGFVYTTPGFCNEKLFFYKASDLNLFQQNLDHGEIIEPYILDFETIKQMIKNGRINDAKTIIGLAYSDFYKQ